MSNQTNHQLHCRVCGAGVQTGQARCANCGKRPFSWWHYLKVTLLGSQILLPYRKEDHELVTAEPQPVSHLPTQRLNAPAADFSHPVAPQPLAPNSRIQQRYTIVQTIPLVTCNYYIAEATTAEQSYHYLLYETMPNAVQSAPLPEVDRPLGVLVELERFTEQGRHYIALQPPDKEGVVLSQVATPVVLQQAIEWTLQIGHILRKLPMSVGGMPLDLRSWESIYLNGRQAQLTTLAILQASERNPTAANALFLASLLYYLHIGTPLTSQNLVAAAPQVRAIIRKAQDWGYGSLSAMLHELQHSGDVPVYDRMLRQSTGTATHNGRVRTHNEDSIAKIDYLIDQSGLAEQTGLYIVADGMGGHAAGELASRTTAEQAFRKFIEQQFLPQLKRQTQKLTDIDEKLHPHEQLLRQLVEAANQIVYQSNQLIQADRGTTITTALVIGKNAFIANVGDSRTYLWRNGRLQQLTEDHSLVYRLYQAGQISRDEIYTHEQKNAVYRSLGETSTVEVDSYRQTLQRGDKLLLCSDGLWEMVRDDAIAEVVATAPTAQTACDQLIHEANLNGGEDNISVVIVTME